MKRLLALALVLGALVLAGTPASAYTTYGFWPSNSITVRFSNDSFPEGDAYRSGLVVALRRWNHNPSKFDFAIDWADTSQSTSNSENEVWAEAAGEDDPPAECVYHQKSSGEFTSTDVIFYQHADWNWTAGTTLSRMTYYGGSRRPFQTAAIHEFGHALGLDHEDDEYNSMGNDKSHIHANNGTGRCYPGEDASDGAVAIYGTDSSAGQDVSVSHWKYYGPDGDGYSDHEKTNAYRSDGVLLGSDYEDNGYTRRFEVYPGQVVQVEFTFENNGRSSQSPVVGYYVSTNDAISTHDTLLDTRTPTLNRNGVYTFKQTVTIPSTLTIGNDYYLGAVVDYNGAISEFDEDNNSTYIPIKIVSP